MEFGLPNSASSPEGKKSKAASDDPDPFAKTSPIIVGNFSNPKFFGDLGHSSFSVRQVLSRDQIALELENSTQSAIRKLLRISIATCGISVMPDYNLAKDFEGLILELRNIEYLSGHSDQKIIKLVSVFDLFIKDKNPELVRTCNDQLMKIINYKIEPWCNVEFKAMPELVLNKIAEVLPDYGLPYAISALKGPLKEMISDNRSKVYSRLFSRFRSDQEIERLRTDLLNNVTQVGPLEKSIRLINNLNFNLSFSAVKALIVEIHQNCHQRLLANCVIGSADICRAPEKLQDYHFNWFQINAHALNYLEYAIQLTIDSKTFAVHPKTAHHLIVAQLKMLQPSLLMICRFLETDQSRLESINIRHY